MALQTKTVPGLTAAGALSLTDKIVLHQGGAEAVRSTLQDVRDLLIGGGAGALALLNVGLGLTSSGGNLNADVRSVAGLTGAITADGLTTALALAAGDISGLGAFATGTDAANLTGTVASARLAGSYTGITGLGTVTTGTLGAGAVLGGVTMTLGSDANGDMYYRAAGVLSRLAKGTAGQLLTMNAGATAPEWATPAASGITALTGDVTASGSGSVAATLVTAQPGAHTWAAVQTFTLAPVFTDDSGTRTALGLGSAALLTAGAANGVATLDSGGLIPTAQLPLLAITDTFVVASQVAMLALTAEKGDVAVRSDQNKSYILSTNSPSTLADWKELLTPTDTVLSVAGLTGAIAASGLMNALSASDLTTGTIAAARLTGASYSFTTPVLGVAAGTSLALTSSANASFLSSTGGSNTGSNATSAVDISWTLNTSGSPDVIALRVTDTARGASTRLLNIYNGASGTNSAFSIDRSGNAYMPNLILATGGINNNAGGTGANFDIAYTSANVFKHAAAWMYAWSASSTIAGSTDLTLSRSAAGILQVGTTAANALGSLNLANLTATGTITNAGGYHSANSVDINNLVAGLTLGATQMLGWSSVNDPGVGGTKHLLLSSGGAATLVLGAATSATAAIAQTLTVSGSSGASAAAALFTVAASDQSGTTTIGGELRLRGGNGTSVGGAITFYTSATTTPTARWNVSAAGHLLAATDGLYNIGASGATRPANIYFQGSLDSGIAKIIGSSGTAYFQGNAVAFRDFAGTGAPSLVVIGPLSASYPALKRSTTTLIVTGGDDSAVGGLTVNGPTQGLGYSTGAGGSVSQATDRTTGVTLNKTTGQITTQATSLAPLGIVTFTVTNSAVATTDNIILSKVSGDIDTSAWVSAVAAGSFNISLRNNDAVSADTTAYVTNFAVIKGVTS